MLKANLQQAINSKLPNGGGKCQYDDGGWYAGKWESGMAHGHGVCGSAPNAREVTEFSGHWQQGFEVNGVCHWSNGTTYEGQWLQGKQHGLGVETKGRWTYKGEWTHGSKGRYGSCKCTLSNLRYDGSWTSGVKDGYGVEIYPDEGSYHGQWMRGMRHGYGVRQSAPYIATLRSPLKQFPDSTSTSDVSHIVSFDRDSKMAETRGGFVLQTRKIPTDDVQKSSKKPGLFDRLGKQGLKIIRQKSAGDLNQGPNFGRSQSGVGSRASSTGGSVRSTASAFSQISSAFSSSSKKSNEEYDEELGSFCSDADLANDRITEKYAGEWKNDKRSGFGICERSDGVKYEGEWLNNRKHGYGVTTLSMGIRLEGKYKNNILVSAWKSSKLFSLRSNKVRDKVESSVDAAQKTANMALQKMETANVRMTSARVRADQADEAAKRAIADAEIANKAARQYSAELQGTQIIANRQQSNTLSNQIFSPVDDLNMTSIFNQKVQQNQTAEVLKKKKKFSFFKKKEDFSWRTKSETRNPRTRGFPIFGTNPLRSSTSNKTKTNEFTSLNTYNQAYESMSNSTLSCPTTRSNPTSTIEHNHKTHLQPLDNSAVDSKLLISLNVPTCPWSDDVNSNSSQSNWMPKPTETHRPPLFRDSIYNIATSQRNKDVNIKTDSPNRAQFNRNDEIQLSTDKFSSHDIDTYCITNRNQDILKSINLLQQGSYTIESVEANTVMRAWPSKDFQSSNQSRKDEKQFINLRNENKIFLRPETISTNYANQTNENIGNDFELPKDRRKSLPSIIKDFPSNVDDSINRSVQASSSSPSKMIMAETSLNIFSSRSTAAHPADNVPTDTYIIENGIRKRLKHVSAVKDTNAAPKVPKYEVEVPKPSYKRGDMGSLPNVSAISDSEILPREIVYQLSQRRREELMRQREEMEKRYGGNIVLRIEDILEWFWRKKMFIIIFLINVAILCVFFSLLKDN